MSMADQIVWGLALVAAAALVVPYALAFRRRGRAAEERKAEAVQLGIDQPRAQYPYIDPALCIGCGTCVSACPEGDVLGVVGGVATIINGLRCIGHGKCEPACPVGAIQVGLGDVRSRADMPLLDPSYESSVPGVYVVGELGGLALIRYALEQGQQAAAAIAERLQSTAATSEDTVDVAIVGAGPAGLAAALEAQARGLTVRVLEQEESLGGAILHYPRRKLVLTQPTRIPCWGEMDREEYTKEELLAILQECVGDHGVPVQFGQRVLDVSVNGRATVQTTAGAVHARTVVLATGRRGTPRKLGVPGEDQPNVMYRLLDAASYSGRRILVVGGGDSAVEAAAALADNGNEVTLSYRKPRLLRVKRKNQLISDQMIADRRMRALFESNVTGIDGERVHLTTPRGEHELQAHDIFVFIGGEPPIPTPAPHRRALWR